MRFKTQIANGHRGYHYPNAPPRTVACGCRISISSLALCVASSAGAQGNLDQSKTADQLYASNCATCHESLASVSNTKSFVELKSFLSQHYTSNRELAANLAATWLAAIERQKKISTAVRAVRHQKLTSKRL
jgi:cytochrome c553